jgi:hypothetical protein
MGDVTALAQRSSAHEWFNTAIAVVALLVSGTSAYFAWQSDRAKREALTMVVRLVGDCRTEYHGGPEAGQIGLCWAVTLANESEKRLSIVDQRIFDIQDGNIGLIGGFRNLEAANGIPLSLPITLDGGEAREIFVRGGVMVPPTVARAIAQMPEFQNHTLGSLPLASVQRALAMVNMDFIGNKVEPTIIDGKYMGFSISPPMKGVVNVLTLTTGRGATFSTRMTYPPNFDRHQTAP